MLKIAVLGAGVMATALTFPAVENGNEVRLIGTHLDDDIICLLYTSDAADERIV